MDVIYHSHEPFVGYPLAILLGHAGVNVTHDEIHGHLIATPTANCLKPAPQSNNWQSQVKMQTISTC